jgi:sulfur carrier protein
MDITVNGTARTYPVAVSVAELVTELGVGGLARGVAVALNGEVVPRSGWATTVVAAGDRVEVLTASQGG